MLLGVGSWGHRPLHAAGRESLLLRLLPVRNWRVTGDVGNKDRNGHRKRTSVKHPYFQKSTSPIPAHSSHRRIFDQDELALSARALFPYLN